MHKGVALVTGASRGIGAATASLLAKEGYAVAVHYAKGKEEAEAVAAAIQENGGKAAVLQADIAREADVSRLFAEAEKALGPLMALVNNAAMQAAGPVESLSAETLNAVFSTNAVGTFLCCREAVKRMKKSGGAIVNVSSEAAKFGGNQIAAYAASKAAVNTLTLALAREAAAYNIRVNAVSPGVIDTGVHTPEKLAALKNSLPFGRAGTAEEVAEAILWMLSDKAGYVSGTILTVAGAR